MVKLKEWRFDGYGRGADDVTRFMAYWMRLGAVRPMFDGEPRDMLWFANPNHALLALLFLTVPSIGAAHPTNATAITNKRSCLMRK